MASLVLTRTNTGGTKTLTGSTDWEHYQANVSRTRMTGTPGLLSDYTKIGAAFTELGYNDDGRLFSATDPSTSDHDGIYSGGTAVVGNGFSFTVPAGTSSQTLICYFGQYSSDSVFRVSMTGGGVTSPQTDSQADPGFNTALASNFTIVFQAASAGQTLTVSIEIGATFSASYGNVTISALALSSAAGAAGNFADFAQSAARSARRLSAAASDPLPPLGRAFVSMAVPIDRAPARRVGPSANDAFPALAAAAASSPAPDLAIGPPRARLLALVPQGDPIPPVVSRTIEATTATAAPRPISPRQGFSDPTPPSALFLLTGGFDTAVSDARVRGRSSDASQSPLPPAPAGWTPDTGVAAPPTARPARAPQSDASPPSALFRLLGGFEFTPAAPAARPRIVFALDAPPPSPFFGWTPPAPEGPPRARPRAVADAVLGLPIPVAIAALTAWAPDLATGQRGWRRAPAIPYGGDPLPALIATAQVTAWGYELPPQPARGARRPAGAATDPIGPLILAWGFELPPAATRRSARADAAASTDPIPSPPFQPWGYETPPIVWRSARPAGAPPADPIAALIAAWGWELVAAARPPRPRSLPSPDLVLVGATPPVVVPPAEADRRRIWTPPPAPTAAIPLFVAPVVLPWGYETVEAARRPRIVRSMTDTVVAGLIAAIRIPRTSFGSGATRSGGSGGPTRSGGSSTRTK